MKSFFIGNIEIKTPVIQGGMGVGISLSGLASAVANEGGVGVISCAGLGLLYPKGKGTYPEKCINGLKEEIRKARAKTKGIIGVNVMVALSNYADMVRTAIEEKIDVVFSGAGLPLDLPSYLTPESTTKLVPIVSSSRAAKIICDKWQKNYNYLPDAIVVEGPKAGGHLGFKKEQLQDQHYALETLIPEVVMIASSYKEQKQIPVIAAGAFRRVKILHILWDWELQGYKWEVSLLPPRNVTRPRRSRKYIFTPSPKMFLLLKVLWECQDELLTGNLFTM